MNGIDLERTAWAIVRAVYEEDDEGLKRLLQLRDPSDLVKEIAHWLVSFIGVAEDREGVGPLPEFLDRVALALAAQGDPGPAAG